MTTGELSRQGCAAMVVGGPTTDLDVGGPRLRDHGTWFRCAPRAPSVL
jgi:hypothetical protein